MFRWILDDTRALIADLKSAARRLSSRWHWFRQRSNRRLSDAAADFENIRRGAETRSRMCASCRALIPVEARRCPECGEIPGRAATRGVARMAENMMPSAVSVSSVVLGLNLAMYGVQLMVWSRLVEGGLPRAMGIDAWEVTMDAMGANVPVLVMAGQWWRLLSSVFLHGGMLHVGMNCWALLAVGPLIEEMYGARKMLVFWVLTGMGGSLASTLWRVGTANQRDDILPGIGASGAIFGLIGVALVWGYRRGGALGAGVRAQMVQWAAYGLLMGFVFAFDNAAHVGGLVTGVLLASVVQDVEPRSPLAARAWEAAAWIGGLAIMGTFALVSLSYGETLRWFMGT
ncbi:MAG: rhomboid family intramembrane serine protease [Candidatus Polarisedimenticolia bacterium]